jgi:hypothetical protein
MGSGEEKWVDDRQPKIHYGGRNAEDEGGMIG